MSPRARVFATRNLPGGALERLARQVDLSVWSGSGGVPEAALAAGASGADGLLCLLSDRIDSEFLGKCPFLQVVSSCSAGVDHIDLAAAAERGIPVGHTPGVLTETTADLAFALMLAAARRIPEADRFVRAGGWQAAKGWDPELLLGRDVHGATLGIVGLGAIGRAVARRASGFGMRVLAWSRSGRSAPGALAVPLATLLATADFVSIHVALNEQTRGLLDAAAVAQLRPGAIVVNTARGGIIDEVALARALTSGAVAAAALDVFKDEPLAPDSPLLAAPNLVLTPHIGSASIATRTRMAELAVENLLAGLAKQPLPHCANRAQLSQASVECDREPGRRSP